jgi:uncharacterized membrane protein YqjE
MIIIARMVALVVGLVIFALSILLIWTKWHPVNLLAIAVTIVAFILSAIIASVIGEHVVRMMKKAEKKRSGKIG